MRSFRGVFSRCCLVVVALASTGEVFAQREPILFYAGPPNMLGLAEGGMKASVSPSFIADAIDVRGFQIEWGDGVEEFVSLFDLPRVHQYEQIGRKEISVRAQYNDERFSESQVGVVTANERQQELPVHSPAFQDATGFGSETKGGRGGELFEVTSLSGGDEPGTIRHALAASGPRRVVFTVSGVIELGSKSLEIKNPYVTIDGSTAPGQGVVLKDAPLVIMTHDVIVRHLKIRPGDDPQGVLGQYRNALQIIGHDDRDQDNDIRRDPYNIIVDHCSLSWSTDQIASTWFGASHITFSWNLFSEALSDSIHNEGPHSTSVMFGPDSEHVSFHHNIIAHGGDRNPLIYMNCSAEVVSNVIYNWRSVGASLGGCSQKSKGTSRVNLISNLFLPGPDTTDLRVKRAIHVRSCWSDEKIFVRDNLVSIPGSGSGTQQQGGRIGSYEIDRSSLMSSPAMPLTNVTIHAAEEILDLLTAQTGAGAHSKSDDPVDKRIKREILSRTGAIIDSPTQREGYTPYR